MAFTNHNRVIQGELVHSYASVLNEDAATKQVFKTPLGPPFVMGKKDKTNLNPPLVMGGNSKTDLIFLHGWRANALVWRNLMESLTAQGYRSFAPDLPGFGKSPAPRRDFFLNDYCAIVKEYISTCKAHQPITLIGHSFGGRIGIKLASQNKPPFSQLVLIDSAGIPTRQNWYKTRAIKTLAHAFKFAFKPRAMQPLKKRIYRALGAEDYLATPELKQTFINIIEEDLSTLLPRISVPTLIIWGEQDAETPLADARMMHKQIPNSKLITFKNAGHFSFLDEQEKTARAIAEFVL